MHTTEHIEQMFIEMGLGTEIERAYFVNFSRVSQDAPKKELSFIISTNNTKEETANGKLERHPQ